MNDINDVTPVFIPSVYTTDVVESVAGATVVKTLTVIDDDTDGATQTLTIQSGMLES